jgi:hypothetical protein
VFLPGMLVEVRTDEKVTDPAPRTKGNF